MKRNEEPIKKELLAAYYTSRKNLNAIKSNPYDAKTLELITTYVVSYQELLKLVEGDTLKNIMDVYAEGQKKFSGLYDKIKGDFWVKSREILRTEFKDNFNSNVSNQLVEDYQKLALVVPRIVDRAELDEVEKQVAAVNKYLNSFMKRDKSQDNRAIQDESSNELHYFLHDEFNKLLSSESFEYEQDKDGGVPEGVHSNYVQEKRRFKESITSGSVPKRPDHQRTAVTETLNEVLRMNLDQELSLASELFFTPLRVDQPETRKKVIISFEHCILDPLETESEYFRSQSRTEDDVNSKARMVCLNFHNAYQDAIKKLFTVPPEPLTEKKCMMFLDEITKHCKDYVDGMNQLFPESVWTSSALPMQVLRGVAGVVLYVFAVLKAAVPWKDRKAGQKEMADFQDTFFSEKPKSRAEQIVAAAKQQLGNVHEGIMSKVFQEVLHDERAESESRRSFEPKVRRRE